MKKTNRVNAGFAAVVGCEVTDGEIYTDGFSFCVEGELNAYKAAYAYRGMARTKVEPASHKPNTWVVSAYRTV